MFETVYQWVLQCLSFALTTFENVLNSTGTLNFYVTGFFLMFAISAFFGPLIFHAFPGSDGVQPHKSDRIKAPRYTGTTTGNDRTSYTSYIDSWE